MTKDDDIVRLLLAMATGTDYQERKHDIILKAAAAEITRLRAQRAAIVEECSQVAETLGARFDEGSQQFISSEPDKYDQMQERAGGCYQAAKAIRALAVPAAQENDHG